MTTSTMSIPQRGEGVAERRPLIPPHAMVQIAIISVLFIALHWDIIRRLALFAWTNGDWSHAFVVPVISLAFVYLQREKLRQIPVRTFWPALPIMLIGLGGYFLAIYPVRNDMLKGYAMILELLGLVWFLTGTRMIGVLWFPILYLAFGVKVSYSIWEWVATNLQFFAARASTVTMNLIGIDAEVHGATISLFQGVEKLGDLNVAEACSGLRSLMMLIALGVAVAWLFPRPWWARIILVALTVPIAVAVNVLRVTILGVLYLIDPELSTGDFHTLIGLLLLLGPALGLFMGVGWALDQIVIEEPDEPQQSVPRTGGSS